METRRVGPPMVLSPTLRCDWSLADGTPLQVTNNFSNTSTCVGCRAGCDRHPTCIRYR